MGGQKRREHPDPAMSPQSMHEAITIPVTGVKKYQTAGVNGEEGVAWMNEWTALVLSRAH